MTPTFIRNHADLIAVCRARADELNMIRQDIAGAMLILPPIKSKTLGPTLAQLRMVMIAVPEDHPLANAPASAASRPAQCPAARKPLAA